MDTNLTTSSVSAMEPMCEFSLLKRNLFSTMMTQKCGAFQHLLRLHQIICSLLFNFMRTPAPKDETPFQVRADPELDYCAEN